MLDREILNSLPPAVDEFVAQEPAKLQEIKTQLADYRGRLDGVVSAIDPQEILGFETYVKRQIPPEQRGAEIVQIMKEKMRGGISSILNNLVSAGNAAESRRRGDLFLLSKSDHPDLKGLKVYSTPEELKMAFWQKDQILRAFNHPLRIKVRHLYEEDLRRRFPDGQMDPLPSMNSPALEAFEKLGEIHAFEEFIPELLSGRRISRRLALAIGPYTVIGPHHVGIPFGSETMPDVVGNPIALAALVQCHAIGTAPRNNIFSEADNQGDLILETMAMLGESPILEGRDDSKEMLSQWDRNLGILVEANPYKACKRIGTVLKIIAAKYPDRSIGHVRIYMVEGADEMIETAQIIHKYFPQLEIYGGQIINDSQYWHIQKLEDQYIAIQDAGIFAGIGMGVVSGTQCSTGARAGVAPQNINLLYRIRKHGLDMPIFTETGIPHQALPVALAAGVSRVNYSAGLLGWLDANGHEWGMVDSEGRICHPYDGEAGPKAKQAEGRIYTWDMVMFQEGEDGLSYPNSRPTIPHALWWLSESVVLTDIYHHYMMPEDMIYDPNVKILHMSEVLQRQVRPYHPY